MQICENCYTFENVYVVLIGWLNGRTFAWQAQGLYFIQDTIGMNRCPHRYRSIATLCLNVTIPYL